MVTLRADEPGPCRVGLPRTVATKPVTCSHIFLYENAGRWIAEPAEQTPEKKHPHGEAFLRKEGFPHAQSIPPPSPAPWVCGTPTPPTASPPPPSSPPPRPPSPPLSPPFRTPAPAAAGTAAAQVAGPTGRHWSARRERGDAPEPSGWRLWGGKEGGGAGWALFRVGCSFQTRSGSRGPFGGAAVPKHPLITFFVIVNQVLLSLRGFLSRTAGALCALMCYHTAFMCPSLLFRRP